MLDVHPPHATAHTWKDFLIHIATIVVGLLIAVGLEQSVEFLHRRAEVRETRERIRQELATDRRYVKRNISQLEKDSAKWQSYSVALQSPQVTAAQVAAMEFDWSLLLEPNAAWELARQSAVFAYMPASETVNYAYFYRNLAENYDTSDHYIDDVHTAAAIVGRVRKTGSLDAGDRERLLILADNLNSRAANQLEIYGFFSKGFEHWADRPGE